MESVLVKVVSFIAVIVVGYLLKRVGFFRAEDFRLIAGLVLKVTLPCAIISNFTRIDVDAALFVLVLLGLGCNLVTVAAGWLASKRGDSAEQAFNIINFSGYNVGCFALPFLQSFVSPMGVVAACIWDTGNSIMCTGATYSIAAAVAGKNEGGGARLFFRRMFSSVPMDVYVAMTILAFLVDSVWNVGIKTAAAQNMVAVGFIQELTGHDISWLDWFVAAAPFAALMSVVLYVVVTRLFKGSLENISGGDDAVRRELAKLGPMSAAEWKLTVVSLVLLFMWVTEKKLHPFDTTTTTVCAIALLMLPSMGVMDWKSVVNRINWGTLLVFGVGISLGSTLLSTHAAQWLAEGIGSSFGLADQTTFVVVAVLALFLIIIHLGFASAAALSSALIPIIIALVNGLDAPNVNVLGITMILQYVISFGFILPVNAPQNLIAYSTGAFDVKTFAFTGIILTIAAYLLILLMSATYWSWMGLV